MTWARLAIAVFAITTPIAAIAGGSLVASRPIMARTVVVAEDIKIAAAEIPGALSDPAAALGRETRVTIYGGRPIRASDLRAPTLVERNEHVRLRFDQGLLSITANGRALDRGASGDRIRVMNLSSRKTVVGEVTPTGEVSVAN